jgi:hypothetical protein
MQGTWGDKVDDVELAIARERLAADMKKAQTRREILMREILSGTSLEYLSARYGVELSKLRYAKSVLEKRAEKEKQHRERRNAVPESPVLP